MKNDNKYKEKPVVQVLMSTYNGEKYLKRQIESIIKQECVICNVIIRDDGSTDETKNVLEECANLYPGKIEYYLCENIGYKKSFLKLLEYAQEADYYAFADQDDVWNKDKVILAIEKLENINEKVKLYVSNVRVTNEKMEEIGFSNLQNMPNRLEALFTRTRFAGCTFVYSQELLRLCLPYTRLEYKEREMPDHDFLLAAIAYSVGEVYIDFESHLNHVRHKTSVTSGGNGIIKRIKIELYNIFIRRNVRLHMAQLIVTNNDISIKEKEEKFLREVLNYKNNLFCKLQLIFNPKLTCGIKICDLETKFKILIGRF